MVAAIRKPPHLSKRRGYRNLERETGVEPATLSLNGNSARYHNLTINDELAPSRVGIDAANTKGVHQKWETSRVLSRGEAAFEDDPEAEEFTGVVRRVKEHEPLDHRRSRAEVERLGFREAAVGFG